jgi:hypothetical protein
LRQAATIALLCPVLAGCAPEGPRAPVTLRIDDLPAGKPVPPRFTELYFERDRAARVGYRFGAIRRVGEDTLEVEARDPAGGSLGAVTVTLGNGSPDHPLTLRCTSTGTAWRHLTDDAADIRTGLRYHLMAMTGRPDGAPNPRQLAEGEPYIPSEWERPSSAASPHQSRVLRIELDAQDLEGSPEAVQARLEAKLRPSQRVQGQTLDQLRAPGP